jgi:lysophospholipase L1-like esterase
VDTKTSGQASSAVRQGKRPWRIVGVALCLLVALAVGTEATLRLLLGLGDPVLIAPDAACSYITKPDQKIFRFLVHTYINHYGMRSDEVSREPSPGAVRVLFVGDSITYGTTHVDQSRIFTQIVARGLPAVVHRPVEVLNASANGWAPDNEWSWVRSRGILQSNFVLLVLNDGDLTEPRATIDQVGDGLPQKRPATAIGEFYTRFLAPRIFHIARRSDPGDTVATNDAAMRANLEDLSRFRALVASQKGRMVLVFLPFRKDVPALSTQPEKVLHTWGDQNQVPFLDLTSAISRYSVSQICLYDHTHFNAAGNQVIGEAILKQWPELGLRP